MGDIPQTCAFRVQSPKLIDNMSLPATITVTDGVTPQVFGSPTREGGNSVVYFAPSANGDLLGRPTLRISHEVTKAGIVRATTTITTPVLDASGKYSSFTKEAFTSTQSGTAPTAGRVVRIKRVSDLLGDLASELASADI